MKETTCALDWRLKLSSYETCWWCRKTPWLNIYIYKELNSFRLSFYRASFVSRILTEQNNSLLECTYFSSTSYPTLGTWTCHYQTQKVNALAMVVALSCGLSEEEKTAFNLSFYKTVCGLRYILTCHFLICFSAGGYLETLYDATQIHTSAKGLIWSESSINNKQQIGSF